MRAIWKFGAICLLGIGTLGEHVLASEPRSDSGAADSNAARGEQKSQAAPVRDSENWRMVCKNHDLWYWTPQKTWMAWNGTKWVHALPSARYSADRQSRNRSFSYQSQPLDGVPFPSQEQVNSGNMTGLGYEGLRIPVNNANRTPVRVLTGDLHDSTYALPPEVQVHSSGTTGLGYEGLR